MRPSANEPEAVQRNGESDMLKHAFAIGIALLFLGSAADAQVRGVSRACAADIKALCAGIQPGASQSA